MSSLQEIRRKQIAEIIDADKDISKKVFQQQFQAVKQFQDILKEPSPMEKKISYEIEKYIIELESLLTDIQNELEQKLAPFEAKILQQVGEPDIKEEDEKEEKDEEPLPIGLIEGSGKRYSMKGGVKEVKFSLLEIWNKFVNYISKLAELQKFTQNDFLVLYDRLDDLLPLLQSITRLNQDAKSVNVPTIGEGVIEVLQNKIDNRDISSIIPSKDLPSFSSVLQNKYKLQISDLEKLVNIVLTKYDYEKEKGDLTNKIKKKEIKLKEYNNMTSLKKMQQEAKRDIEIELPKLKNELNDLEKKWIISQKVGEPNEGISPSVIQKQIKDLKQRVKGRFPQEVIKASRQPLRGQGKTSSSQILKNFGDDVYRVYESIPSLSYDELEDLYIDLEDKRKFAQEHDDKQNWDKYNFLLSAVLSDERAKDIQSILGNGRKSKSDYKYSRTSMPMPFRDADNEMYSY